MARTFLVAAALLPLRWVAASQLEKERPVMKVVRMLQDMSVELQNELDDDKKVHEMLGCWCSTNEQEKTTAIETAKSKIAQLESTMAEAMAKMTELKEKRAVSMDEINANHAALTQANELRMKENKAFHGEETDLLAAIQSIKQAKVVLAKHNRDFVQIKKVVKQLQDAKVTQLMMNHHTFDPDLISGFKGFLQQATSANSASFLSVPGFQSYAPQSGQIFGVLSQMQEEFEATLSESQKSELKSSEDYESLKAAKEEEIAAGKKAVVQMDEDLAQFSEEHAQAAEEHEDTSAQLALDEEFLANLQKKCAESEAEFEERTKNRMEEIKAVDETITILNDDAAFDVFDKTVSSAFVQVSTSHVEDKQRRSRAVAVLQKLAGKSPQLALLAANAQLDAFVKVKEEIDKLVTELTKQQAQEVEQRDWCKEELAVNDRETAAANDKKTDLETKMEDLKKTIESQTNDIKAAQEDIAETEKEMKQASENREAENGGYQGTIADQRLTQVILQKAVNRMKEVYAEFLQQQPGAPHIQTSGTHTDPGNGPARFDKYEQHAGGLRVIALLEKVLEDSKTTENDAIAAEEDAQAFYENMMQASNKAIARLQESIANLSEARAKAKSELNMSETDHKQTMKQLQVLSETAADVHLSCDFVLNNFDARQAARAAEIEALNDAKAILSGMK